MKFSKEEIKSSLINILKNVIEIDCWEEEEENIDLENLANIGLNSMTFLQVVVQCEEKFEIEFADEELDYEIFGTIGTLVECIEDKLENC